MSYNMTGPDISSLAASVFIGAGAEGTMNIFAAKSATLKTGYYIQPKDKLFYTAEVVNYKNYEQDVYVSLEYEYVPGGKQNYMDVQMGALNVDGCAKSGAEAMAPPRDKPVTFTSPEWIVVQDGYLTKIIPHMHDGGVASKFYLNGKVICNAKAIYAGGNATAEIDGQKWDSITAYEDCDEPVKIRTGDKITLSVDYDLTKYRLRPSSAGHGKEAEAMGLGLVWFAKELPGKQ